MALPLLLRFDDSLAVIPRLCETEVSMVYHYLVQGRVQGVGFRWFVQREAAEIGLNGWVRNTVDGKVEVVAAGTVEQIDELRAALKQGSRGCRVDAVVEHALTEAEGASLGPFQIEGAW